MVNTHTIVLAVLLVLSGCGSGVTPDDSTPTTQTTPSEQSASTDTTTPPPTSTPTITATPVRELQNPWKQPQVTVAMTFDGAVDNETRHEIFLKSAILFWNENADRYTPFSVEFTTIPNPAEADIVVNVTPTISYCSDQQTSTTYFYCTDSYGAIGIAEDQSRIAITSRYNDNQTRVYYREAFAVLLGIDEPTTVDGIVDFESPRLRDPWPESNPVVVNIHKAPSDHRNYTQLVSDAISYWETGPGAAHRNYSVNFVLRPTAEHADITIRIVDSLIKCGDEYADTSDYIGCAPIYSGDHEANHPTEILLLKGYTNETTRATLRHEFGHLHGRLHGHAPVSTMNATYDAIRLPIPNATELDQP